MTEPNLQFALVLHEHNKSITNARHIVFTALQAQEPMSMKELVEKCVIHIDRASIYRSVELFEQLGILQRLQIGWKYKLELSSSFNYHHHHLTCTRCNGIIPLPEDSQLEKRLEYLAAKMNFKTIDHQIEIKGICKKCQTKETR
jgi:Fur family ferric uptake transcriptional regulator